MKKLETKPIDISKITDANKIIHIYYINKIKMCDLRMFEAGEDEDYARINANDRAMQRWCDKAGIPKEYQFELLSNISWNNDDCISVLESLGWTILKGKDKIYERKKKMV